MFIPIFILGLVLWLGLARLALRWVKLEHRRKVWRWFLVATLLICTADHIAGIIYAHVWVAMAQGRANLTLKTDSIAEQRVIGTHSGRPEPIEFGLDSHFWLTEDGYSKLQAIKPSITDREDLSRNAYEIYVTSNANDQACQYFFTLPKDIDRNKIRGAVPYELIRTQIALLTSASRYLEGGDKARCIGIRPIPRITARYLKKSASISAPFYNYPRKSFDYNYTRITDLSNQEVLCETRRIIFWGGWVFRYFLISPDSGMPPGYNVNHFGKCDVRPFSRQRIYD